MESLRARLRAASRSLPRTTTPPSSLPPSRVASLPGRRTAVLAGGGALFELRADGRVREAAGTGALPAGACALAASGARVAVLAPRGVAVVTLRPGAPARVDDVAAPLFAARPQLAVAHAAWHPHADDYLVLLTSDGSMRVFDVAAGGNVDDERMRLRVVTSGDVPVCFAFGNRTGWDALAVYVLTERGAVYVASPVAPVGTRLSRESWLEMRTDAVTTVGGPAAVSSAGLSTGVSAGMSAGRRMGSGVRAEDTSRVMASPSPPPSGRSDRAERSRRPPLGGVTVATTPRRQLVFSALDEEDDVADSRKANSEPRAAASEKRDEGDFEEEQDSWAVRQARLQLRFLDRAFEQTQAGDMLLMREFKPAPLLFQGPLHVERDDTEGRGDSPAPFVSLLVLDLGPDKPPVLLRSAADGTVSVLLGMELVEGQWFLSEDRFGTTGDNVLAASNEYAEAARIVAPALLCLERLEFPARDVAVMHVVRGRTDFDVLFARCGAAVYAVRLSFVAALSDAEALRRTDNTSITPLLSTSKIGTANADGSAIVGLAPIFEKAIGPLAIALTADGSLEASAPLRWMSDDQDALPKSMFSGAASVSRSAFVNGTESVGPSHASGARGYGQAEPFPATDSELATEVRGILGEVFAARESSGFTLGAGSIGRVADAMSVSEVLSCVESRLAHFTGTDDGRAGAGDQLKTLSLLIPKWADEVLAKTDVTRRSIAAVREQLESREVQAAAMSRKLQRAKRLNENLRARIATLREIHEARNTALTPAETARREKLRDRRRRANASRLRLDEVAAAVRVRKTKAYNEQQHRRHSAFPDAAGSRGSVGRLASSPLVGRWSSRASLRAELNPSSPRERETVDMSAAQLQRLKEALAKHSASIQSATERTGAMWQMFAKI